jgi:hypothetical protein
MIDLLRRLLAVLSAATLISCHSTHAPPPQRIDQATVNAMSHALLDAYDRADEDGFARAIDPTFVLLDELRLEQSDAILSALRKRRERQAPARSRTYGEQHVSIGSNAAVFVGETVERYPPDSARPTAENTPAIPMEFDGWSTIVWARNGEEWKAASWQWVKGGSDASREKWDAIYREGRAFNPEPSKFLVEMLRGRKPGLALDVGMGQGRNALYLASKGWRVKGIDISDEGIRQAREAAAAHKLTIEAIHVDAETWDYGVEKWDLAVLIYANGNDASLQRAMKPGGNHRRRMVPQGLGAQRRHRHGRSRSAVQRRLQDPAKRSSGRRKRLGMEGARPTKVDSVRSAKALRVTNRVVQTALPTFAIASR